MILSMFGFQIWENFATNRRGINKTALQGKFYLEHTILFAVITQSHWLKPRNVFENFLICFVIASHMLHDDVTITHITNVSLI